MNKRIIIASKYPVRFYKDNVEPESIKSIPSEDKIIVKKPDIIVSARRDEKGNIFVPDEEFAKLVDIVNKYKNDDIPTIIYTSLSVATRWMSEKGTYRVGNVFVGLTVPATGRLPAPSKRAYLFGPVSILTLPNKDIVFLSDFVEGKIINMTSHPLHFIDNDTGEEEIVDVYFTFNIKQKWVKSSEDRITIYRKIDSLPREEIERLNTVIKEYTDKQEKVVIYVSFLALKVLVENGFPTNGEYYTIVNPITTEKNGKTVALKNMGQKAIIRKKVIEIEKER